MMLVRRSTGHQVERPKRKAAGPAEEACSKMRQANRGYLQITLLYWHDRAGGSVDAQTQTQLLQHR